MERYKQLFQNALTDSRKLGITPLFLNGAIAQLGERLNGIQEVVGSIPSSSTIDLRFTYPTNLKPDIRV